MQHFSTFAGDRKIHRVRWKAMTRSKKDGVSALGNSNLLTMPCWVRWRTVCGKNQTLCG